MRLVVALGGNALLRRGEPMEAAVQRRNIAAASNAVASLARDHHIVVTHGNGPQIGLLALQAATYAGVSPYPLDILGAESEGMIGYLLEEALANALPGREVATLLTRVEIDPSDPAFARPTKPIGPLYSEPDGKRLAAERGWTFAPDGERVRRVVPSPRPKLILGTKVIRRLMDSDVLVICAGGGGIPVTDDRSQWHGVEAVVDKDWTAALLATEVSADGLLLLTDVEGVFDDFRTRTPRLIRRADPESLLQRTFEEGSMGPKVAAACHFATASGRWAAIGNLEEARTVLSGGAGTRIEVGRPSVVYG